MRVAARRGLAVSCVCMIVCARGACVRVCACVCVCVWWMRAANQAYVKRIEAAMHEVRSGTPGPASARVAKHLSDQNFVLTPSLGVATDAGAPPGGGDAAGDAAGDVGAGAGAAAAHAALRPFFDGVLDAAGRIKQVEPGLYAELRAEVRAEFSAAYGSGARTKMQMEAIDPEFIAKCAAAVTRGLGL